MWNGIKVLPALTLTVMLAALPLAAGCSAAGKVEPSGASSAQAVSEVDTGEPDEGDDSAQKEEEAATAEKTAAEKAAEEERIVAEKAVKEQAMAEACTYDCAYFTLTLPVSWYERWSVSVDEVWHPARITDQPMTSRHTFFLDGVAMFDVVHKTSNLSMENRVGSTAYGELYFEPSASLTDPDLTAIRSAISPK